MKYKKFYSGKLEPRILENLDATYRNQMKLLIKEIDQGPWTKRQRKRQKRSIISNIALYRTFIEYGIAQEDAKKLTKEYSFYIARKAHKVLKTFFYIPGFFYIFRLFMKKGMEGEEICAIFCLCDHIVFGNIEKLQFERSQTLGMGGERCDFCFRVRTK